MTDAKHSNFKSKLIELAAINLAKEMYEGRPAEYAYLSKRFDDAIQVVVNDYNEIYGHFVKSEEAIARISTKAGVEAARDEFGVEEESADELADLLENELHEDVSLLHVAELALGGAEGDPKGAVDALLYMMKGELASKTARAAVELLEVKDEH